jgi:hypothetical protein
MPKLSWLELLIGILLAVYVIDLVTTPGWYWHWLSVLVLGWAGGAVIWLIALQALGRPEKDD